MHKNCTKNAMTKIVNIKKYKRKPQGLKFATHQTWYHLLPRQPANTHNQTHTIKTHRHTFKLNSKKKKKKNTAQGTMVPLA